jgi:hypothetical protein
MEDLPVELISMIAAQLQESNFAKQPFSHITETSADRKNGWLVHTKASIRDVSKFRIVCSKLRESSLRSFGNILGDRVFRFTEVGLQDLQAMSNTVKLRHHIQTLTFGNAQFDDWTKNSALRKLLRMLPEPDQTRLCVAYSDAYQSQQRLSESLRMNKVVSALRYLPGLTSLRLLYSDYPSVSNHLGGWLGLYDSALIAWVCAKNHSTLFHADRTYAQYHDDVTAFVPVLEAINCTEATIRDLRLGPGHVSEALACVEAPRRIGKQSVLNCINLDLGPGDLCLPQRYGDGCILEKILWSSPNVTRLMLSMYPEANFTKFAMATSRLVDILKSSARLYSRTVELL